MGLIPLEFADGITDSPSFRTTLQLHEREIDKTNTAIKHLIKDIRDLINAARNHSRAQRALSETLNMFNFECIGNSQTDDEMVIAKSFSHFAQLLKSIEDERDRLLEKAEAAFLEPIEKFRRNHIGSAKEAKKKFDKETAKHYQSLERYLATSTKKGDTQLQEADASYAMEQRNFFKEMSDYVLKLQEVNERKKFEFVESVLSFMIGWITFYHQGHEIANDFYSAKVELQTRLQRTRNNFQMTQDETQGLRQKLLNNTEPLKKRFQDCANFNKHFAREGYLFLMEKKAFSTSWTKHFCQYDKRDQKLKIIQYNQTLGKINLENDSVISVRECIRRDPDSIDRRFCFDIVSDGDLISSHSKTSFANLDKDNGVNSNIPNGDSSTPIYTFQALSEDDYKQWMEALDGRDPTPVPPPISKSKNGAKPVLDSSNDLAFELDDEGACFVRQCIKSIESKGLEHKGIYRIVGVASKVRFLIETFGERRKQSIAKRNKENARRDSNSPPEMMDTGEELFDLHLESEDYEIKTVTSALKNYLRNLVEPIMTFHLNNAFLSAAKVENRELRIAKIHFLVHMLPPLNFAVLKLLIYHLQKISFLHEKNMMTPSNLGVCFGPTLLRTKEESVAAILDIKFVNVIAELLIENYDQVFLSKPALPQRQQEEIFMSLEAKKSDDLAGSSSSIQARPLPHVPTTLPFNSAGNNLHSPNSTPLGSPISRALGHGYAYNQMVNAKMGNVIRRSSSQDQLSNAISNNSQNSNRNNRQAIYGTSQLPAAVQRSGVIIQTLTSSPRKPGLSHNGVNSHLGPISPSSSPSSTFSSQATGATQQAIYQPPMVLKNAPVTSTSGNGHYGLVGRQPSGGNLGIQPSISYQNLHYNSEVSAINADSLGLGANLQMNSGPQYSRPMTSIGYIPMNPYYEPLKGPNSAVDSSHVNSMLPNSSSNVYRNHYQLSSSSSIGATSLPTTPDTLNPPTQFGQAPFRNALPKPGSISPQPSENIYEPLPSVYGQPIYGAIGSATNSAIMNGIQNKGAKVRTKYPCKAGSDQELSFNSNVIITNVRTSREPGWLEGCLNGQTGLIPQNYVEFIPE